MFLGVSGLSHNLMEEKQIQWILQILRKELASDLQIRERNHRPTENTQKTNASPGPRRCVPQGLLSFR